MERTKVQAIRKVQATSKSATTAQSGVKKSRQRHTAGSFSCPRYIFLEPPSDSSYTFDDEFSLRVTARRLSRAE